MVCFPKLYTRDTCPQAWYFLIIVPVTYNRERGSLRIEYLNDIRRTPSMLRELYLMRAIFFAKYTNYEREEGERTSQTMRRIPCREATKDPNFCNTKTTAHCLGEYYAPGQGTTRVCC
ncbi:hypothetical protein Bca52824_087373 [Brassica carinata]|uniref:Uncharacterized protein n=1 Tax=Brassica carinata TaxID=52824 RepID=A0A8X7PAR3_BRACI|nr:hypothetical protein Bca52824_087373 [Brassica carinata]